MAKMKGIYKSFKYISQIFVVKEREMDIGYPTDVKHVAHIGWDGQSGSAPSWMNEFKAAPDFSTSIGNPRESGSMSVSTCFYICAPHVELFPTDEGNAWGKSCRILFLQRGRVWLFCHETTLLYNKEESRKLMALTRDIVCMVRTKINVWEQAYFEQSLGPQPASESLKDIPPTDLPNIPKKQKRKKKSSTSSPKSSVSSRSSRAAKAKSSFSETETAIVQV
ncbi:hypothetical protein EZV62_026384 [Acer yangbiense]|uniref:CRIB domain-containing protein n=1 Tax=Acer yangbiense TaxID=1000413 RepID=A0A5C7GRE2_9ROSI|nr:hypothetical protein EZV62_026384 [Acer yangbiense]